MLSGNWISGYFWKHSTSIRVMSMGRYVKTTLFRFFLGQRHTLESGLEENERDDVLAGMTPECLWCYVVSPLSRYIRQA